MTYDPKSDTATIKSFANYSTTSDNVPIDYSKVFLSSNESMLGDLAMKLGKIAV